MTIEFVDRFSDYKIKNSRQRVEHLDKATITDYKLITLYLFT